MKPLRYTRHAKSRMRQHRIDEESVVLTLAEPDQLVPSIKNRYNALKRVSDKIVRVTFVEEANHVLVITVSPRRRFQGGENENRV